MKICSVAAHLTDSQTTAWFDYDIQDGVRIKCGNCGLGIDHLNPEGYDNSFYCPGCKIEIQYPGWASW